MATKIGVTGERAGETSGQPPAKRRRGWWIAVIVGVAGLAGAALALRRSSVGAPHPAIALPALPNLTAKPGQLQQQLSDANRAVAAHADAAAVIHLGELYHANGYIEQARACWSWLRDRQPREARWAYYLADLSRTEGDYERVEALLRDVVQLAPDYAPAWLQLAQLEFKTGRLDQAETDFNRRLTLLPGDPYARLGLARIALQRGLNADARKILEALVHDVPTFQPSLNLYAELLAAAGDQDGATKARLRAGAVTRFREAEDPWLEALNSACYDPKRLAVLGTIDFQTNHGDRGRGYLERALELSPEDDECAKALSSLYLKIGEVERARTMLERTIPRINPPDPILYVTLAEAARLQHRSEDALRIVDQALPLAPRAYQLYNERGAVLGDLGRLPESVAEYRRAIELNPTDTDSNYSLGITLLALRQREEAITYLKRSLTLQPSYPRALIMLGRIELEAGNLPAAASYLRLLYELHPDQEQAQQLMAQWYLRAGLAAMAQKDSAGAEENFRAGFAIDANNASLALNLGSLYLMQGRPDSAAAPLEVYHRVNPDDPQGLLFLGQCYVQLGRIPEARTLLERGAQIAEKAGNRQTAGYCREILQQL